MSTSFEKTACIVAHYHPKGDVPLDLEDLVYKLSKISSQVIFVSTNINKSSQNKIEKICQVISRENFGYDFWSYKLGIDHIEKLDQLDGVLLLNSSIITFNHDELLRQFINNNPTHSCLYGLTSSKEITNHLQSYWIKFHGNDLINSDLFSKWWSTMSPISNYQEVIMNYEIGISKYFLDAAIPLHALYQPSQEDKFVSACRAVSINHQRIKINNLEKSNSFSIGLNFAEKINPTLILSDRLLSRHHFIKEKALNPTNKYYLPNALREYLSKTNSDHQKKYLEYIKSREINFLVNFI